MKIGKYLAGGKYLRADDLGKRQINVEVEQVREEQMAAGGGSQGEVTKPVMYFKGKERGLVLNSTNIQALVDKWGEETDNWSGLTLTLYTAPTTDSGGRPCKGLRVRPVTEP